MPNWIKEESGWYTHEAYEAVCKEAKGLWYTYPLSDKTMSLDNRRAHKTLAEATNACQLQEPKDWKDHV